MMRATLSKYVLLFAALGCGGDRTAESASASTQASTARDSAGNETAAQPRPSTNPERSALRPKTEGDRARQGTVARRSTILFVGTSLTAGLGLDPDSAYPQLIQRKIDSAGLPYQVVNAGVSGETSSSLLRRIDWLLRQPIELIVIETGANDGLRGIPIETMRSNVQQVIDRVKSARPNTRIVLVQMEAPPNLGISYTQRFRAVFPDLAEKNGAILLPFLLDRVAGRRELNQADGIHPNAEGERIVAENVWKGLRPLLN
jgi:acyl-CoA thioesterase I